MSDYTKGKIYIIKCLISNKCYIGSTCTTLHTREKYHKNIYNVCSSKEIIKNGNYNFELLEKFPCSSNRELEIRERYYQDIYKYLNVYDCNCSVYSYYNSILGNYNDSS